MDCDYKDLPHSGGGTDHGPAVVSRGGYHICQKCHDAMMRAEIEEDRYYTHPPKFKSYQLVEDLSGRRYTVVECPWNTQSESWDYRLAPRWSLPPGQHHRVHGLPESSLREAYT